MKNYLLLLAVAAPLVLGSCNKDDDAAQNVSPNPITGTINELTAGSSDPAAMQLTSDLLSTGKWKLSGYIQTGQNTVIYKDLYSNLPGCQKDDLFEFSAGSNSLTVSDGLNYCNGTAQPKTGTWSLTNSTNLNVSVNDLPAGLSGALNIIQLSETEMVLKQNTNGMIYIATYEKYKPTRAELLMHKNWRKTAETEQINGSNTFDVFSNAPACEKDDFMRFESNNQLRVEEGPTKCNANDPQTSTMNYYFNGGSSLNISYQGANQQYYIMALDASTLVMQTYYYGSQGYVYTTSTYTAF